MAFKVLSVLCLAAAASAQIFHPAPTVFHAAAPTVVRVAQPEEVFAPATYAYSFQVSDPLTGDSKSMEESADNGVIHGSYSVAQPDGRLRLVTYTASEDDGFQAHVTYDGEDGPPSIPFDVPATVATVHAAPAPTVVRTAPAVFHAAAPTPVFHALPAAQHVIHA